MRQLTDKFVDGEAYQVSQFGASQGLKVLTTLTKLVGPSISMAFGAEGQTSETAQAEVIGRAVNALCEKLDEEKVLNLIKTLIDTALVGEGKKIVFETHFQGRLGHLFKVLKAVLEVQYGDFLSDLKNLSAGVMPEEGFRPMKSTGESGG